MKAYETILRETAAFAKANVPLNNYTTFRIGGKADLFLEPRSEEELVRAITLLKREQIDFLIIGNGSNLLVSDRGYRGAVIRLAENFSAVTIEGNKVTALAGCPMAVVANRSLDAGLQGLEWASGIPGTLGGAVAMNAGAYGGEIKQVIKKVRLYRDGEIVETAVTDGDLGYRSSAFSYPKVIVLAAELELSADDGGAKQRRNDYNLARRTKQPLEFPSAGSTFKRPAGYYAGALIEQCGLKGFTVGGASVSVKHAGFVVSDGTATAADVYALIGEVQKRVLAETGVKLEPEIKLVGDFT